LGSVSGLTFAFGTVVSEQVMLGEQRVTQDCNSGFGSGLGSITRELDSEQAIPDGQHDSQDLSSGSFASELWSMSP
jgi:hypothetical protein